MTATAQERFRPVTTNGNTGHRNGRATARRDPDLEGLTAGALYDMALHGRIDDPARGALTAAALDVHAKNAMDVRRLIQPWQARAMSYYDLVPEVKFAAQFMSQMLSKVRMFPARIDPDTREPEEIESGPEVEIFNRIVDRNGGRSELQRSYAKLKFLIGECYLTVSPDKERGEVWECLSPNELRVQPGGIATRFRAPMLSADQYEIGTDKYLIGNDPETIEAYGEPLGPAFSENGPDIIVVYRLWRPSPAYTWLADCNMQSSVDLLEELVLSTYSVRAQLKSRLNQAGLLLWPDESSFTSPGNEGEEDPNTDEFQERLTTAMMTAIGDPGSASAFSPIIARIAGDVIKDVKYIRFNDNQGEMTEISQRGEMIERFGVGAELPPDLFKTTDSLNHWNVWMVDEQTWKSYGDPSSREMASDINTAYLQPECRAQGIAGWENIVIGIDPSEVINHPDRSKDAQALYDRRAISKTVLLESLGYNANDLPPEDELNEMIGVAIRDGSYARYGIPAVRANIEPGAGEVEGADPNAAGGAPVQGAPETVASEPGSEQEPRAPQAPGPNATNAGPAVTASAGDERALRILGAADAAVQRGREIAGSRLRAMTTGRNAKKCVDCDMAITGIANWDVAATLGEERVADLFGAVTQTLVDGTGHSFASVIERMGVSRQWASELGALVEVHTARTLYQADPGPLPRGFVRLLDRIDIPQERA